MPPKPKEFDKITLMFISWAVWGTKFKSHPSEGLSKLRVGGTTPLLIAKIAGDSLSVDLSSFFQLMAIISINLGIINILPFPGLDGGHALIAIIEGVIGRRIPTKTLILIQWIGITLLMILFFIIIKNDISTILSL